MRQQTGFIFAATVSIGLIATATASYAQDKTIKIGALLPISGPGA